MESEANQQCDGTQRADVADLRTQLRATLIDEFQQALSSAAAITEEQRNALRKIVTDDSVTSQAVLKALNTTRKDPPNG